MPHQGEHAAGVDTPPENVDIPRRCTREQITIGKLADVELWDGRITWCRGFHGVLPVFKFGEAPSGLVTLRQLHEQRLRRRRGQDVYALLAWRGGRRFADLYRIDLAVAAYRITPAKRAAVAAMERARRTCRGCHRQRPYRMPMSTWRCWECMAETGDYGSEPAVA